jgi:hypothetical protein
MDASSLLWFNEVSSHLQSLNYKQSEVDSCEFFKTALRRAVKP